MELNEKGLRERKWWTERGYKLPEFDREAVREATGREPVWVHFGAGNIFRAFPARAVQELLDQGIMDQGLVAAEGYDTEILERVNRPHDEYSVLVTLKADGTVEKTVVGSVLASYGLDGLKEIFTMDSLQIASFTITEKGYGVFGAEEDFKNGPGQNLYGPGGGASVPAVPCGEKAHRHGQHGQLLPQRGPASGGHGDICRKMV